MTLSEFLKEQGCYEEFVKYDFLNVLGSTPLSADMISQAFTWDETDSGYDFWSDVSVKWGNLLNEHYLSIAEPIENTKKSNGYMVFVDKGSKPSKRHECYDDALDELKRVMNQDKNVNGTGYVLEIKNVCRSSIALSWE